MMSGHGANPIFCNKKKKKIGRSKHLLYLHLLFFSFFMEIPATKLSLSICKKELPLIERCFLY